MSRALATGAAALLACAAALAPRPAAAGPRLLEGELILPDLVAAATAPADESGAKRDDAKPAPPATPPATPDTKPRPKPGSLDFDLLGAPPKVEQVDEGALRTRRTMLTWHQGVGLGMFALQLATTVVGQLNYTDKFGGDNTGKWVQPHAVLAYSTLGAFVAAGTLALLAPRPFEREGGFDRVSLHKLAMFSAAAGMLAQGVLGVWTRTREGYLNQQTVGTVHLAVGYFTLAAVATGVGAIMF